MGASKARMMDDEDKLRQVQQLAIEFELVEKCEDHGYLVDQLCYDEVEVRERVNRLLAKNDPRVTAYELDGDALVELLKKICSDASPSCPGCDAREEDG